jgi:vitamin B12 transporter
VVQLPRVTWGDMNRIAFVLIFSSSAYADEPGMPRRGSAAEGQRGVDADETIVVTGKVPDREATRDRDRALGEAPFVTVIHPDDQPATASVADAVGAAVGAQTRSLGGLGAYESVSVRGASPGHTEVLIDGVPLARIAAVTQDLGRFALDAFGQVDFYRGAVPVELGGAGVGGALNLITRLGRGEHGERFTVSIGGGSFGARHVRLHYGDDYGEWLSSTTIGYEGATGDYTYYSDNGTILTTSDDSYKTRDNNHFDQFDASSRIGKRGTNDAGGVRIAYKDQGLPGSVNQPSTEASLATLDLIGDIRDDVEVGPAIAKQKLYALIERQHLRDPLGELGLGAEARDYLTLSGGASSTWSVALGRHVATAGLELRADRFRDGDASGGRAALIGNRVGGAVLAAVDLVVDPDARIIITPAVRLDVERTVPTVMVESTQPQSTEPRYDTVPSPRLSALAKLSADISVKTSAGWYVRLPTLIELFGDRGTLVGSPELQPERGPSADAGLVWAPGHAMNIPNGDLGDIAVDRVLVEADGFATRPHDIISLVPSAGASAYHAINIADALTYGAELVAAARIAHTVSITANYTHTETEQLSADATYNGKQLPRIPPDVIYARVEVARHVLDRDASIWCDGTWQSETYLDQTNLQPIPARLLVGAGVRVEVIANIGVSFNVANLTDLRVEQLPLSPPPSPTLTSVPTPLADYFGFPLPGRSYYLTLDWSHS